MFCAPLLALTLALAPSNQSYRVDVYAAGHLDVTTADNSEGYRDVGGRGGLGVSIYLRRLIDDDAPPSLQGYLQRTPALHLDGGGGSSSSTWDDPVPKASGSNGWADLSISGYARWLYAGAHVGLQYQTASSHLYTFGGSTIDETSSGLTIPVDASVGVRWRDTLVSVGWGVSATRSELNDTTANFTVPFWGGARAAVTTVLQRQLSLGASVLVLEKGAAAGADATLYRARRLGFSASIKGGHQSHSQAVLTTFSDTFTDTLDYVGFGVGVVVWASPNVYADLRYDFEWDKHAIGYGDSPSSVATYYNTLRLGIGFRR